MRGDGTFTANVPPMSALAIHVGAIHDPGDPEPVDVTFTLAGDVPAGETAYMVGDVPQLGGGDDAKTIKLTASGGSYTAQVADIAPNIDVTYRYFTKGGEGAITEDPYGERSFLTPRGGTTSRTDTWGKEPVGDIMVSHSVTAQTVVGQSVYVVGNVAELGSWDPAKAVKLNTDQNTYSRWWGQRALPPNTKIEYKYIIKEDGKAPIWENGGNRMMTTPNSGEYVFNDGWFRR